jgi:hypothetical protein
MSNNIVPTPAEYVAATKRPTVAQAMAEIAAVRADVATVVRVVTDLAALVAQGQAQTSAAVAEATVTAIGDAPSKAAPKRTRKATGRKATVQEAAQATVQGLPTIAEAHKLVAEGADPWKVKVLSATTGKPIPFKLVMQAEAHAGTAPASKPAAKPARKGGRKATVSADDAKRVFALGGKELAALAAGGDKAAAAEIARRAAKRAK